MGSIELNLLKYKAYKQKPEGAFNLVVTQQQIE